VVVNNINIQQDQTDYYYHDHYEAYLKGPGEQSKKRPARPQPAPKPDELKLKETY
jgi:hypothetical protein